MGISHAALGAKTISYEYLRAENRADGICCVVVSEGSKETALKFEKTDVDGENAMFMFANPALDFPQRLERRAPD